MSNVAGDEYIGDALQMKWDAPAVAFSTPKDALARLGDTAEIREARRQLDMVRVSASNVPYHPLVLAGSYHTYRISSKFPVPGGAIQDDRRRAGGYDVSTAALVRDAAKVRAELERKAEADGIAAELMELRLNVALPVRDEDSLPGVQREQLTEGDDDWETLRRARVPHWPRHEMFPAGDNELHLFQKVKANDVEGIRAIVGRRELELDVAEPATMKTLLMTAAQYGRLEIAQVRCCRALHGSIAAYTFA